MRFNAFRAESFLTGMVLTALVLAVTPRLAHADSQQQQSFTAWRQMQDCSREAAKKFPDHTPEGNAQREAERRDCLRRNHLPVPAAGTR